jgi:predicted GNAT family N-acyltransferase
MIQILKEKDWKKYLNLRFQLGEYKININEIEFIKKYNDMKKQGGYIYVIIDQEQPNKIIATGKLLVEIKFGKNIGHIEDVIVDMEYRKFGYGTCIVDHLIKIAKYEQNCYKTILTTKNELSNFYYKSGMKVDGVSMVIFN